jgi:hypothetical protein
MKATLFSADFVKDSNGNLKLLEINTDTTFVSSALDLIDYTELHGLISSSNIDVVNVIYKDFQRDFVTHFSQSLYSNDLLHLQVEHYNEHLEEVSSIYPHQPSDLSTTLNLRLAYDESAILDSTYAKNNIDLFKLFVDNDDTGSLTEFAYSSSLWNHNTLTTQSFHGVDNLPEITVKQNLTNIANPLDFYKIGQTDVLTPDNILTSIADEFLPSGSIVQRYYVSSSTDNKVSSFRSFNIVYGSDLNVINILNYKSKSILEKPQSFLTASFYDSSSVLSKIPNKHYFELTTNGLRGHVEGVLEGSKIVKADGTSVLVESASLGDSFKSFTIPTSPNTDLVDEVREWYVTGSELPSGSTSVNTTLQNKTKRELTYNVVSNISLSGSSDDNLYLSPYIYMLTYDIANDRICYRTPYEMTVDGYKLFDTTGSLVSIDSISFEVLDGEYSAYTLDMEETDTFFLHGTNINIKLLTHNCFVEGTQISIEGGHKNIEDIQPGDAILTWDESSKEIKDGVVTKISKALANDLVRLTFENSIVVNTTSEHPFYVENKGWVKAKDLEFGDECIKSNGEKTFVSTVEIHDGEVVVYNLHDVTPAHTFFANDILVHNKCFTYNSKVEMWDGTKKSIGDIEVGDKVKSIKNGIEVMGTVTDTLIHPTNDVVPVVKFGNSTADPYHPFYQNNKWEDISKLENSEYTFEFIDNFYNLEIDGNDIEGSEHNFIIDGVVVSGLGDNMVLNSLFMRQNEELLKKVI